MYYTIIPTTWENDSKLLREIRRQVFIEEQNVPEELEWDDHDKTSFHVLALDEAGKPIGCARLKPDGQIGRMAVAKRNRGQGVGTAILEAILLHARRSELKNLYLHAQIAAIPFYRRHGFIVTSDEFMDANIAHKTMRMAVTHSSV